MFVSFALSAFLLLYGWHELVWLLGFGGVLDFGVVGDGFFVGFHGFVVLWFLFYGLPSVRWRVTLGFEVFEGLI